jgi:hypothetical protein
MFSVLYDQSRKFRSRQTETGFSKGAAIISVTAFLALKWTYANAPSPLDAVNRKAAAEHWTSKEPLV